MNLQLAEAISSSGKTEYLTVVAEVIVSFPESPIQQRQFFQPKGSKIQSFEIS